MFFTFVNQKPFGLVVKLYHSKMDLTEQFYYKYVYKVNKDKLNKNYWRLVHILINTIRLKFEFILFLLQIQQAIRGYICSVCTSMQCSEKPSLHLQTPSIMLADTFNYPEFIALQLRFTLFSFNMGLILRISVLVDMLQPNERQDSLCC